MIDKNVLDKRIIIVGVDKDETTMFAQKLHLELGLKNSQSVTTRKAEEGEQDGAFNHFINKIAYDGLDRTADLLFKEKVETLTETYYNGILEEEWDEKDVFILTPELVKQVIKNKEREDCFIIYLNKDRSDYISKLQNKYSYLGNIKGDEIIHNYIIFYDKYYGNNFKDYDVCLKGGEIIAW